MNLQEFREQFPITESRSFLFAGAQTPAARTVEAAMRSWIDLWRDDPLYAYDNVLDDVGRLKADLARLIGADPSCVAITDNTSRASNAAVRLVAPRDGAIVVDDSTYPSSIYPWITAGGRQMTYVPTDQATDRTTALIDGLTEPVAAVAVSHVAPLTGRRHDIRRLSEAVHERGAVLVVDVAQTAGVEPLVVEEMGADVVVGTTMKWLLGPPGVGFLCAAPELTEGAPLAEIGYMALDVPGEDWPKTHLPPVFPDARRFELGFPNAVALRAASEGIRLVLEVGVETIQNRVAELVDHCVNGLDERGVTLRTPHVRELRGGVVAASVPDAFEVAAFLRARGVDIGGYRWGLLRVDPPAFCELADIQRFLDGFDAYTEQNGDSR